MVPAVVMGAIGARDYGRAGPCSDGVTPDPETTGPRGEAYSGDRSSSRGGGAPMCPCRMRWIVVPL